jgi:Ca2+:H+ antiporter
LHPDPERVATVKMSEGVSVLLLLGYLLSLVYTMYTHKRLFHDNATDTQEAHAATWSLRRSIVTLIAAALTIGLLSEILVSATEEAREITRLSEIFVGLILIPIIGNAAENSSAILMAMKGRMDLAVELLLDRASRWRLWSPRFLSSWELCLESPWTSPSLLWKS